MWCFTPTGRQQLASASYARRRFARDCVGRDAPRLICQIMRGRQHDAGIWAHVVPRLSPGLASHPHLRWHRRGDDARPKVARGVIAVGNIAVGGLAVRWAGGVRAALDRRIHARSGSLAAFGVRRWALGLSMGGFAVGSRRGRRRGDWVSMRDRRSGAPGASGDQRTARATPRPASSCSAGSAGQSSADVPVITGDSTWMLSDIARHERGLETHSADRRAAGCGANHRDERHRSRSRPICHRLRVWRGPLASRTRSQDAPVVHRRCPQRDGHCTTHAAEMASTAH